MKIENELHERVEDYLRHVAVDPPRRGGRKRSSATVDQYHFSLTVFLTWADREGLADVKGLTEDNLGKYVKYLRDQPGSKGKRLGPVTQATYIRALNLFTKWLKLPVRIDNPKAPDRDLTDLVLTRAELTKLRDQAVGRDLVIVDLLTQTGMRVGELVNLTVGGVEKEEGQTFVKLRGKTGERWVPIKHDVATRLTDYIRGSRRELSGDQPVFLADRKRNGVSEQLTRSGVGQLIRHLAKDAKISKKVYPHLLRHTFASHWMEDGGEAVVLAKVLGHADLTMIMKTYTHPSRAKMGNAVLDFLKKRGD